ncbi:hypothetical protein OEZ85_008997 [Tetradesmus obliquus]|uniref:Uncharacterized protein n=1 Tax=Tetradesmus obliquus TaxID=3088 RepID=A0ABY8TKU6_TETOB|nr:hypothetical protein OEZ85_008997 [Tetradesmus obliquus]
MQTVLSRPQTFTQTAAASRRSAVRVSATYQQDDGGRSRGPRGRGRFSRRPQEERVDHKEFLYLPKPNHLVYIKPTVAVVADVASRASVGLKMTIGNNQLERYVIEYYSKRL